jgi:hypothetical protein
MEQIKEGREKEEGGIKKGRNRDLKKYGKNVIPRQ